jgi:uncharacterized damage-inducible protein DinB
MDVLAYIKGAVADAHRFNDIAAENMTSEVGLWQPQGTANTIQALLAHVVTGEDNAINRAMRAGEKLNEQPAENSSLFVSKGWSKELGIPTERGGQWTKGWKLNLDAFHAYRKAVHKETDMFLETLTEDDLEREVFWFNGANTLGGLMRMVVIHHQLLHSGEISTLKGLQGLKGLPM